MIDLMEDLEFDDLLSGISGYDYLDSDIDDDNIDSLLDSTKDYRTGYMDDQDDVRSLISELRGY